MLYSVKMRSAQGGPHEQGGRHISGAERILSEEKIEQAIVAMLRRAQKHQRGMADFISLKVEAVKPADIFYRPLLPLSSSSIEAVPYRRFSFLLLSTEKTDAASVELITAPISRLSSHSKPSTSLQNAPVAKAVSKTPAEASISDLPATFLASLHFVPKPP